MCYTPNSEGVKSMLMQEIKQTRWPGGGGGELCFSSSEVILKLPVAEHMQIRPKPLSAGADRDSGTEHGHHDRVQR